VEQPTVILGGYLSTSIVYRAMRDTLAEITGQPAYIVPILGHEWWWAGIPPGWAAILLKTECTVRRAATASPTGKVTLIGHSAGGVLSRLYLSPAPFLRHRYSGIEVVDHLITLGSPHNNRGRFFRDGWMARAVYRRYPGAYFAPQVRYTSVAGRSLRGEAGGSAKERWAHTCYRELCGDGEAWGDGLVPVPSALLEGSEQIVLDGIAHYGGTWYGSPEIIPLWWRPEQSMRAAA